MILPSPRLFGEFRPFHIYLNSSSTCSNMASIDFSKLGGMNSFSTLDEPVSETLMRDLRSVGQKLQIVLTPLGKNSREEVLGKLRDWDLWGPLLVCLMLSTILSSSAPTDSGSVVFASVFVIVWSGAAAVTLNAQLLGGKISFLQSVCILGYCVFPLTVAAMVLLILG